ncbi:lipopolysaccharide-induced tumor necrosis factor-alpha factor homolog isoform X2 [Leguminivora glycinivorella]|uniref:lipopolysaccharide-induced tumor necrosis factor-alpha factor homolog isoform X2 n=1 Tax=Leguminivora glycinivorella TaxID=1035111 RepID=UPI00200DDEA0|nr:lipopolysaccharide-induced tumor necrosis factor-alpha factor homolog isoform X2 [Leguminivora glycinivorella]
MESKEPTTIDAHAPNTSEYPAGPPPYSGYPPGPPPVQVTHVVTPGAVIIQQTVGPDLTHTTCRSCHQNIVTRVERKASTRTHIFAGLLCLFGCWCCVCCPYCMDSCLNTDHYCTNCGAFVGTYIR